MLHWWSYHNRTLHTAMQATNIAERTNLIEGYGIILVLAEVA